jgi:hypothetical protein
MVSGLHQPFTCAHQTLTTTKQDGDGNLSQIEIIRALKLEPTLRSALGLRKAQIAFLKGESSVRDRTESSSLGFGFGVGGSGDDDAPALAAPSASPREAPAAHVDQPPVDSRARSPSGGAALPSIVGPASGGARPSGADSFSQSQDGRSKSRSGAGGKAKGAAVPHRSAGGRAGLSVARMSATVGPGVLPPLGRAGAVGFATMRPTSSVQVAPGGPGVTLPPIETADERTARRDARDARRHAKLAAAARQGLHTSRLADSGYRSIRTDTLDKKVEAALERRAAEAMPVFVPLVRSAWRPDRSAVAAAANDDDAASARRAAAETADGDRPRDRSDPESRTAPTDLPVRRVGGGFGGADMPGAPLAPPLELTWGSPSGKPLGVPLGQVQVVRVDAWGSDRGERKHDRASGASGAPERYAPLAFAAALRLERARRVGGPAAVAGRQRPRSPPRGAPEWPVAAATASATASLAAFLNPARGVQPNETVALALVAASRATGFTR